MDSRPRVCWVCLCPPGGVHSVQRGAYRTCYRHSTTTGSCSVAPCRHTAAHSLRWIPNYPLGSIATIVNPRYPSARYATICSMASSFMHPPDLMHPGYTEYIFRTSGFGTPRGPRPLVTCLPKRSTVDCAWQMTNPWRVAGALQRS